VTSRLLRHTSMRGRLAILLIAALVLPLVGIAWTGYTALRSSFAADAADDQVVSNATKLALNAAVGELHTRLKFELFDLAWRVAHLPPGVEAEAARWDELPPERRPALVAFVPTAGPDRSSLPRALRLALEEDLRTSRPVSGWRQLPLDGAEPVLCDVVIEPRERDGGVLLAVRPLAARLAALSFTDRIRRVVMQPDGALLPVGRVDPAGPAPLDDTLLHELWSVAAADAADGRFGAALQRDGTSFHAALPLEGSSGEPAALVVANASDAVVFPVFDRREAALAEAAASVGWLAAGGVLLALIIGLLAPRFVWADIRDTTDFIFGSVERLRELVSRIGLALAEQARVLMSLSASVARLDADSQEIARTGRALAHSAGQSQWTSQSGHQKAESAQRTVLDMRDRVEEIKRQMEELDRRCAAIGSILVYLDHLTSETDAVSVNATIQAAGAGGSGRQLSAMAGEIQKLTELASGCTREIRQQVEEIQDASHTTVAATQDGREQVERCQAAFEEVEQNFGRLLRWVEDTQRSAQGIEVSTVRQSDALQSVARDVEAIEQRSRETTANFDAVVDAADELADLGRRVNQTWKVG